MFYRPCVLTAASLLIFMVAWHLHYIASARIVSLLLVLQDMLAIMGRVVFRCHHHLLSCCQHQFVDAFL